jgi:hypothetical protein
MKHSEAINSPTNKIAQKVGRTLTHARPQRTVCRSESDAFSARIIRHKKTADCSNCSQFAIISLCSDRYHKAWGRGGESQRELSPRRLATTLTGAMSIKPGFFRPALAALVVCDRRMAVVKSPIALIERRCDSRRRSISVTEATGSSRIFSLALSSGSHETWIFFAPAVSASLAQSRRPKSLRSEATESP